MRGTSSQRGKNLEESLIEILRENPRASISYISTKLGISRSTAQRLVKKVLKQVKFVPYVEGGEVLGFVISEIPMEYPNAESYPLLEGGYMNIVRCSSYSELSEILTKFKDKKKVFL